MARSGELAAAAAARSPGPAPAPGRQSPSVAPATFPPSQSSSPSLCPPVYPSMFPKLVKMARPYSYDTIILGAGWAGAVAARDLAAKGHRVLVLEARDRIGGRAQTWLSQAKDVKVDVGCSWIHGYKEGNPARYLAKEFGVEAHLPKPAEGVVYGPDGPLSSSEATALRSSLSAAQASLKTPRPPPPPSVSLASSLLHSSSPLFSKSVQPDSSKDINSTNPADPSLASQVSGDGAAPTDRALKMSFARTLEVPLGLKLEKASLRWAGWESSTSFAGSDAAPEGGFEALVNKVIDQAKKAGAEVSLNSEVGGVKEKKEGVIVKTKSGRSLVGRTVISTIPLGTLKTLPPTFFEPALPHHLQETISGTHMGVLEKLVLHYPSAWWPNASTIGSYTFLPTRTSQPTESSSIEEIFASSTLICANFACPSLPHSSSTLLTYLSETPATLLLRHRPSEVAEAYHAFLVSRFQPTSPPPRFVEYNLTSWLTDPFSKGATTTPSIISEGGERSPLDFKELGRPVWGGKLGFAGEHTEMEHRGSVAGAVVSGQREGARVDRLLSKWNEEI